MGQFDQAPFPMTHDDVENLIEAIQPTNVYVDLPVSIPTSGWSNSSPYVYTYTNSKITAECGIEVDFLANSENADVMYLEYEKVAGGVQFTAPKKPTVAIPVNIRVINADAEAFESISADMVSTNAVPGAANAEQALSTLNSKTFQRGGISNPTNMNNTSLIGTYFAQGSACSNLPTNDSRYYMIACFGVYQIASMHSINGFAGVFTREYINEQWYPWTPISNRGNWLANNTDLDNVLTVGTYGIDGTKTYTHLPSGMTSGVLEVISIYYNDSSSYVMQRLSSGSSMAVRWRTSNNGTSFAQWYKYTGTQA